MSKFGCRCGHLMDLVRTPAPEEFLLVPERNVDDVTELFSNGGPTIDAVLERLDDQSRDVLICPTCGRIWIQDEDRPTVFNSYVREPELGEG